MEVMETPIKEIYLQALWNEQAFSRELVTIQSDTLEVLYPGKWNFGPGPDFLDARLMFKGREICGDVEIHYTARDWEHHGHTNDPAYSNVILHAVWEQGADDPSGKPLLEMSSVCSFALDELSQKFSDYARQSKIKPVDGVEELSTLDDSKMGRFFEKMAFLRLAQKVERFQKLMELYGEEQAFYQQLMDAFGYTQNRDAFVSLAKSANLEKLKSASKPEVILWGESGLLPDGSQYEIADELKVWHHDLSSEWGKMRQSFRAGIKWSHAGRPQNSPERRLAGAELFLSNINWDFISFFEELKNNVNSVDHYFDREHPFLGFCRFDKKLNRAGKLIGESRRKDIRLNVFYPFVFAVLKDKVLIQNHRQNYLNEKKGEDTGLLREAACRFFIPPSRMKQVVKKYVHQQGLYFLLQNPQWVKDCKEI